MRINVIFGSKSDSEVYEPLCRQLKEIEGVQVYFEVCSAHRDAARLRQIIEEIPCDLYIAGAGLAAHLPGVIASLTDLPVIGVPCMDNLEGVDALLSIQQMPKGKPVLAAGVERVDHIVKFIRWYSANRHQPPAFHIVCPEWAEKKASEFKEPLEAIGWEFVKKSSQVDHPPAMLTLLFADLFSPPLPVANVGVRGNLWLGAPVFAESRYQGDLRVLARLADAGGLWVGVNNYANLQMSLLKLWPVGSKEKKLLQEIQGGVKVSAK